MTNDPTAIVRANFEAYMKQDRAALEKLIAPDFHFTSPIDNRLDRSTYFETCWPNSQQLEKFEIVELAAVRDRVFVTYVGHGRNGRSFQNTEVHTVRNGQVIEVEVYFGWSLPHPAPTGTHLDHSAERPGHP